MKRWIGNTGRVVTLYFDRGEKLREGICEQLQELGIRNAVLASGIGTFYHALFHRVTDTEAIATNEFVAIDGPMELSAVQGFVIDGTPHFHMVFSDLDKTYSGHLEGDCDVLYLASVTLIEILDMKQDMF